jgi:hypothetical protein
VVSPIGESGGGAPGNQGRQGYCRLPLLHTAPSGCSVAALCDTLPYQCVLSHGVGEVVSPIGESGGGAQEIKEGRVTAGCPLSRGALNIERPVSSTVLTRPGLSMLTQRESTTRTRVFSSRPPLGEGTCCGVAGRRAKCGCDTRRTSFAYVSLPFVMTKDWSRILSTCPDGPGRRRGEP